MSIIVYNEVGTPIIPAGDLAGPVREALGGALRSMRYVTPDFAGLYQDAVGTTPVTAVGQPVGLMLDRRFGLERGENISPASSYLKTEDGTKFTTLVGVGNEGRSFEVTFTMLSGSGIIIQRAGGAAEPPISTQVGSNRFIIQMGSQVTGVIRLGGVTSSRAEIIDIEVREIPGRHASQPTTTARPTLRSAPLRIDYDGVDDCLRTVFPELGSNVTIARSIPGVGAQILTGQTIAAGDWDDNVDSCAVLVIDRALTGPETALVTAFLNQQAGV